MKKVVITSLIAVSLIAVAAKANQVMAQQTQITDQDQYAIAGCSEITTGAYGQIICTPIIDQTQNSYTTNNTTEITNTTTNTEINNTEIHDSYNEVALYEDHYEDRIVYVNGQEVVVREHIPADTALDFKSASVAMSTALSGVAAFIAKVKNKFMA